MDIATALIQSLKFSLSIIDTQVSRRYLNQVIRLEKKKYNEENKPEKDRNHAYIDNINNELCIIAENLAKFGASNAKD